MPGGMSVERSPCALPARLFLGTKIAGLLCEERCFECHSANTLYQTLAIAVHWGGIRGWKANAHCLMVTDVVASAIMSK